VRVFKSVFVVVFLAVFVVVAAAAVFVVVAAFAVTAVTVPAAATAASVDTFDPLFAANDYVTVTAEVVNASSHL